MGSVETGGEGGGLGFVTVLYVREDRIGEVRVRPQQRQQPKSQSQSQSQSPSQAESRWQPQPQDGRDELARLAFGSEMRVDGLSPPSERCLPVMVLHTISLDGVWFKVDQQPLLLAKDNNNNENDQNHALGRLYTTCLEEAKTAVVPMDGGNELHLVAMISDQPSFWAFVAPQGLYASCLTMLNLRCLALVFDLDETLILANTMRSFEDRIVALEWKIQTTKMDSQRLSNMSAELRRYREDRGLLKQYVESDCIFDNGKLIQAHLEEVSLPAEGPIRRPVIRIPERNMVLTRINPAVRDTSILVRLRPAWEDLRNYLIAKGRKRFEVFICTMSEKDYALEMWRLLDPDARLIQSKELQGRLLCVKAGSKKSLSNMFQHVHCHPRMAMVIDDRPEVWEDKDQPHVHAVPAFAPYYAPQAEANAPLPILCIARNVACNVRGGFFKDFDEILLQQFADVNFDTDVSTLPSTPHVGNYLSEMGSDENENMHLDSKEFPDGITGSEVRTSLDPQFNRDEDSDTLPPGFTSYTHGLRETQKPDIDPDTQQRLPNGQDVAQPHPEGLTSNLLQLQAPSVSSAGGWLEAEDETSSGPIPEPEAPTLSSDQNMGGEESARTLSERAYENPKWLSLDYPSQSGSGEEEPVLRKPESERVDASDPISALQELGQNCKASIEYRYLLSSTAELQFSVEALFDGNKVGEGTGRTNRDAKNRAAEDALRYLASAQSRRSPSGNANREGDRPYHLNSGDPRGHATRGCTREEDMPAASTSGKDNYRQGEARKTPCFNAVAALKDLCTIEGLKVEYMERPTSRGTFTCEVEISGRILGKGAGRDWECAKHQAAEQALRQLSPGANSKPLKRSSSPRPTPLFQDSNKRIKSGESWRPPASSARNRDRTPPRRYSSRSRSSIPRR